MASFMDYITGLSNVTLHVTANAPVTEYDGMKVASAHGGKKLPNWKVKRGLSKLSDTLNFTKERLQAKLEARKAK